MKSIKKWFCVAVCAATFGGVAAQDTGEYKKVTLFEGETIHAIELSGDFDVVIRQGTPNGVVLEVLESIPVNTVYDPLYGDFKWMMQARDWNKELRDTVQCSLTQGMLRINNLRLKISSQAGGGINATWVSGPKGKAVITVCDLRSVLASSKGSLRFDGKMQTTETELQVESMEGLDLTAEKRVQISTIGTGTISGKISGTPQVVVKANTSVQIDLAVDSVGYLELNSYVDGTVIRVGGTVDSLATRVYQGKVDMVDLKANAIIGLRKDKDAKNESVQIMGGKYILERRGNTITLKGLE